MKSAALTDQPIRKAFFTVKKKFLLIIYRGHRWTVLILKTTESLKNKGKKKLRRRLKLITEISNKRSNTAWGIFTKNYSGLSIHMEKNIQET